MMTRAGASFATQLNTPWQLCIFNSMGICPTCQATRGQWDEVCAKCGLSFKTVDEKARAVRAATSELSSGCPSCKAPRSPGEEICPACGVVYAKWKAAQERRAAAAPAATTVPAVTLETHGNKERPGCLTFMMVASILVNSVAAFILPFMQPPFNSVLMIVGTVAVVPCCYGVLRWKRWGVYGVVLLQIFGMLTMGGGAASVIQSVFFLGIFWHFVGPIWHYFD